MASEQTPDAVPVPSQGSASGANGAQTFNPAPAGNLPKAVEDVMYSDIGLNTLLIRLKQSVASARDFAQFLKKRSSLEEESAAGLKRLAKSQLEGNRKYEVRGGTFETQTTDMMRVQERMADNGMQFALSLHQMHEDLEVMSASIDRGRKEWKHTGLDAEKKASDAEQAMLKAKTRYDSLAEDYDRARTGDVKGSRRIGLKGPKSVEQYEQDLFRKVQAADSDYEEKVRQAKAQRESLLSDLRPKTVRALHDLINECDSALTLQLQKFATFNEKLLLGNGLVVSPLPDKEGAPSQRSLRDIISGIDNEKDYNDYVGGHVGKIPMRLSEIKYQQHPTLAPRPQSQAPQVLPQPQPVDVATQSNPVSSMPPSLTVNTSTQQPSYYNYTSTLPSAAPQSGYKAYSPQAASASQFPPADLHSPGSLQQTQSPYNPNAGLARDAYTSAPYPVYASERQGSGSTPQQTTGSVIGPVSGGTSAGRHPMLRPQPVFGVSLEDLFVRDQSAVPVIAMQCMQAVDLFGLDVEGIYRLSGTTTHVNSLRNAFDTLPTTAPQLDFRNPANFYHDVNSVASLLKQFFRDLPDPLFTRAGYDTFIQAAKVEDANARRDALHQAINDLPDPNYASLRALVLHLHRVTQNESRTRMSSSNLAVCFAPSLMGNHTGTQIADAGLQARVIDTILVNATAIFDED